MSEQTQAPQLAPDEVQADTARRACLAQELIEQWSNDVAAWRPCPQAGISAEWLAEVKAEVEAGVSMGSMNSTVLWIRAKIRAAARKEVGLPELNPWDTYLQKLMRKHRVSRTASGRKRR